MSSDPSELITRRLHVSGLNKNPSSALTEVDITKRLSSFGCNVTAIDGFGRLDALDQPKGFGYVTIEAKKADLARCLNSLSGSTWKGVKLRIGEAKPDFSERIAKEQLVQASMEPVRKKPRLGKYSGVYAPSMDLITPEALRLPSAKQSHPHWKITTMGRMVRVMKMRPERPLTPNLEEQKEEQEQKKKLKVGVLPTKKRKRRMKDPDTRARRRTIDPTMWGSTLLSGIFLEVQDTPAPAMTVVEPETDTSEEESEEEEVFHHVQQEVSSDEADVLDDTPEASIESPHAAVPSQLSLPPSSGFDGVTQCNADILPNLLQQETSASMALLQAMFTGSSDDWGCKEDLDDLDISVPAAHPPDDEERTGNRDNVIDDWKDIEIVPKQPVAPMQDDQDDEDGSDTLIVTRTEQAAHQAQDAHRQENGPPTQKVPKLKDLFTPREEEQGFSLLGHLDIDSDLDLDLDMGLQIEDVAPPITQNPAKSDTQPAQLQASSAAAIPSVAVLDPSLPMFFPHPSSFQFSDEQPTSSVQRQPDILMLFRSKNWDWRSVGFYRTQTEDEIRKRWEEQKGDLTRGWKKRCREAGKVRRRRGNTVIDVDVE